MAYRLRREKSKQYRGPIDRLRDASHRIMGPDGDEHEPLLGHLRASGSSHDLTKSDNAFVRWPAQAMATTWAVLKTNPVNLLLIFVPLGIIGGNVGWSPTTVFILNFLAIIPLAALLSFATEEISAKVGQTVGGLLNATFGNAVELIVSIVALKDGQIRIVQSSMLGSILSNTLLVLGCCFIAGGIKELEQHFNTTVASTMSSLMAVASASLIIPATLYAVMRGSPSDTQKETQDNIMVLSRGTAIILLILYILYLIFQLKTHNKYFDGSADAEASAQSNGPSQNSLLDGGESGRPPQQTTTQGNHAGDEPQILSPQAAGVWLLLSTLLVAFCAEYLVDSIDSIVASTGISKTFIGLILLPIVGNAAEHVTAVVVSYKNKMDLAIGVSIGSSMQIALLVTPFLVILGWIIGQPMTLRFETFETVVFFLSVLVVNYLIQDGKSNYLEGAMCIGIYIIIALAFFVYPDEGTKAL